MKIDLRIIAHFLLAALFISCSDDSDDMEMLSNGDSPNPPPNSISSPDERGGAPAVWLEDEKEMLFFGGMLPITGDTWTFAPESSEWKEITSLDNQGVPADRCHHTLVTDPDNGNVILFGGFSFSGRFNDTWRYDVTNNDWQLINASGTLPAPRCLQVASILPNRNQMLMYGGVVGGGVVEGDFLGDVFLFDISNQSWEELNIFGPGKRRGAISFYSAQEDAVFLWGGKSPDSYPADLWKFDPESRDWIAVSTNGDTPTGREDPAYFFNEENSSLYIALGYNNSVDGNLVGDAFILDLNTMVWQRASDPDPRPRWRPSVAFDPETKTGYMFGGWLDFGGNNALNDTWQFDFNAQVWEQIQ